MPSLIVNSNSNEAARPNGHVTPHGGGSTTNFTNGEDLVEPIAIVGFALQFPQDATSEEAFWNMLLERRAALSEVPKDRWNINAFHKPGNKSGTMKATKANFLKEDISAFDAAFFSITPGEAECMDPQQRLLLETSYHALENGAFHLTHFPC